MNYQVITFYGYDCTKRCNEWLAENPNVEPISIAMNFTSSMISEKGICVLYKIKEIEE